MKRVISIRQRFLLAAIVLVLIYGASLFVRGALLTKRAEAYSNSVLQGVLQSWNAQALLQSLSEESKREASIEDYTKFVATASIKLGRLVTLESTECRLTREEDPTSRNKENFALCWAQAKFEKADQQLGVRLVQDRDGHWALRQLIFY